MQYTEGGRMMEKLCTNFNDIILEEVKKVVNDCNKNGVIIQEVKVINDSVGVCEIKDPQNTDGLLSVELKVVLK